MPAWLKLKENTVFIQNFRLQTKIRAKNHKTHIRKNLRTSKNAEIQKTLITLRLNRFYWFL